MSYAFEAISGVGFFGAVLLLLLVPPFALIAVVVVAVAAVIAVVALAGAILVTPYLLVRSLRGHWRARHHHPQHVGVPAFVTPTTPGRAT